MSLALVCWLSMCSSNPLVSANSEHQAGGVCAPAGGECSRHGLSMLQRSSARDATEIVNENDPSPASSKLSLVHGEDLIVDKDESCAGQPNLGKTAALDQAGFFAVRSKCCPAMMSEFIRRVIQAEAADFGVCDEGSLQGTSQFFDCTDDDLGNDFARLLVVIRSDAALKGDCAWIGQPEQAGGCPVRKPSCLSLPGATNPPCAVPGATTTPPAGCYEEDINYSNTNNNVIVPKTGSGAQTAIECQARCVTEARCTHFVFKSTRHVSGSTDCYLMDFKSQTIAKFPVVGLVSGPKKC